MCVNSSWNELGLGLESPEGHREPQHWKEGLGRLRRGGAARGWRGCGCLEERPEPIKGETGRVHLGRRRDFLLFRCWPGRHEKLILILPGKYCTVD